MQKSTDNHSSGADRELKLFTARQYIPQDLPISVTRGDTPSANIRREMS